MKRIFGNKSKLNSSIDIIMLLLITPVAGIGFLIKYILLPGIERNITYGKNFDLTFCGLNRHQWGTIHLIISLSFLLLLIIHIILHWDVIQAVFKRMVKTRSLRITAAISLTAASMLMISFPLFIKPEIIDREPLHLNRHDYNNNSLELSMKVDTIGSNGSVPNIKKEDQQEKKLHKQQEEGEITGSQTLMSIAEKFNIPVGKIAAELNIPESQCSERLGRLRKKYSFTMEDVREIVSKLKRIEQ